MIEVGTGDEFSNLKNKYVLDPTDLNKLDEFVSTLKNSDEDYGRYAKELVRIAKIIKVLDFDRMKVVFDSQFDEQRLSQNGTKKILFRVDLFNRAFNEICQILGFEEENSEKTAG